MTEIEDLKLEIKRLNDENKSIRIQLTEIKRIFERDGSKLAKWKHLAMRLIRKYEPENENNYETR